jgi:adhesin transport system membrane fusion protein
LKKVGIIMSTTDFNKLSRELAGQGGIAGSVLLLLIILLVLISIMWAYFTELDNVTRGQGKIVSSMQNQLVQASERGVLSKSFIEEGQKVSVGQLLVEIDPVDAKTAFDQAEQTLASLKIQRERLFAEISGDELEFANELVQLAPTVTRSEKALFNSRKAELASKISVLQQRLNQRDEQIQEINVNIQTARETLELVDKQIAIIEPLVNASLASETDLLSLRRQAKDFEGKSESYVASLQRAKSSIVEVEQEIKSAKQSFATNSQSELAKITSEIAAVESRIPALEDRLVRTKVKSPVEGIVNRLNFKTLGGFVTPGDVIAEIVPTGEDLIVEGLIDPKDIAYINPGQKVRISLTAYDASRYGTLDGIVLKVSADASLDQNLGISAYTVDISIDSELFEDDNSAVEILPGMVASVEVLAGKRSVLEYIWQPMAKVKERAFRD